MVGKIGVWLNCKAPFYQFATQDSDSLGAGMEGRLFFKVGAQDETGYIQPTIKQLVDVRGLDGHAKFGSVYHLNGIQSWSINKKGEVKNVHYY